MNFVKGALKTDFTRTGQRTKLGLLEDGRRSAIRYFKNNFADGFRQVSHIFNVILLVHGTRLGQIRKDGLKSSVFYIHWSLFICYSKSKLIDL